MIALRSTAKNARYRSAAALLIVVVGLLVVWEHSGEPEPHVDDAGAFCLAVVSGLSFVGVLSGPRFSALSRLPRAISLAAPAGPLPARPAPLPSSRAGPSTLQVLRR